MPADKVELLNVNHPGRVERGDAKMYEAMRAALLQVLPAASPGLTADQMREAIKPLLPQDLYPGGAKAGWWMKAAQLDLEARGVVAREATKPLRFRRA